MRKGVSLLSSGAQVFLLLTMIIMGTEAVAQTTTPESEYKKLIKVDEDINPLGATPFGESVSLYDGSLSFQVNDITVRGNGPLITVGRTFKADGDIILRQGNAAFGDWDIDLPRLTTITSDASTIIAGPPQQGWLVDSAARTDRCTSIGPPPALRHGSPGSDLIPAEKWWNEDYELKIPGSGSQSVLLRAPESPTAPQMSGLTFVAATKDNWAIACLASTANGEAGEGFLAVSPDGTKYWLNQLVYRQARGFVVNRKMGYMLATRVEDRFGNWVTYTYNGGSLQSIDASDGRRVTFAYNSDGTQIAQVNVVTSGGSRSWTYQYATNSVGYTLTRVGLPDGSGWDYQFAPLAYEVKSVIPNQPTDCADPDAPDSTINMTGTATAPSGLQGTFETHPTGHARSDVPEICDTTSLTTPARNYEFSPRYYNNLALTKKTFSGPGLATQIWTYAYPLAAATWHQQCTAGGCDYTTHADVVDPGNNVTRYTFSNRFDVTEGMAARTDYYSGPTVTGTPVRSEVLTYQATGPWPSRYGYNLIDFLNTAKITQNAPLAMQVVTQDGNTFTRQVLSFDAWARPVRTQRYSNVSGQATLDETSGYQDDYTRWVLGLPTTHVNNATGEIESSMEYDATLLMPLHRYAFGQLLMTYGWNTAGQLASFTDPLNHTTTLSNYKRGIPQSIGFPDSTSESLVVDDLGQISSITNQAGNTTSYLYDSIGRIAEIDYPTGDSVAWAKQTFTYTFETWVSHGIAANHWQRGVTQGPKATYTYFDAMMRPIELLTRQSSDGGAPKTSRTDYDFRGNKTFQSYLTEGNLDLSGLTAGITTNYDALGRATSTVQPSELGNLTTTTNYLSGARKQVIDPKGNSTTSSYQVFDEPSYDNVIQVSAPEGVTQSITRDLYGNPLAISQGGITKSMVYDSFHRLCRTTEPESGSEVMAYDAANNLAWSASGQAITGTDCGQAQVAAAAQTVRGYDAMNRVTAITYPAGTDATAMTYTLTGKPLTATSGAVSWTYGYNKLDLLTAEGLSVDGYSWALGYGYDVNGVLASTVYPDGKAVTYSPDFLGRPTTAGSYAAGATYYPDGDLQAFTFGSGAAYTAAENSRNLLASFSYGTGSAVAVSEDLTYDGNANITQVCDVATSTKPCNDPANDGLRTKSLGYDGLNRLISANASNLWGTESYTYDTLNNIRTLTTAGVTNTYNYDASTNRLTSVMSGATTVLSFGYDTRGNVTLRNNVPMVFDEANRLTQISGLDSYTYDAQGRRVKKFPVSGTPTYYAYNQAGQLMWQYDPATTNGTDYIYLGKKMVASALIDTSAFQSSQINVTLTLIGVPTLSADGTTISVTVDIANNGSVTLASTGRDPVHLGARIFTTGGSDAGVSIPRTNIPSIAPGTHAAVTATIPATAVIGSGNVIRLVPVQEGVAWFDNWGTTPIEVGPFSACAPASTYLCNTQYALRGSESNLALTLTSIPTLTADGQNLVATVDVQNNGIINISTTGTYPVDLGNHFANAAGTITVNDISRVGLPVIPPGGHAPVAINTPVSGGVGSGNRIQFELVQEGLHWFRDYGHPAISTNSFGDLTVPASSTTGAYTVSWTAVPGASSYRLDEQVNGSAWTTVQTASSLSWPTSGRTPGTYAYRMAPCASSCGPVGVSGSIAVSLPPPAPAAISVPGTSTGNIAIGWSTATYATSYTLEQSFNGGAFAALYTGPNNSYSYTAPGSGNYSYRVKACNAVGCSGYGPTGSSVITFPPASAPSIAGGGANHTGVYTITWSAVSGAATYIVSEQQNGGAWNTVQNTAQLSFSRSGMGNGTYNYQVKASNAGGIGPASSVASVVVSLPPPQPANVGITYTYVNTKKETRTMTWNLAATATSYQILDTNTGQTVYNSTSTATSYVVESAVPGNLPYHGYQIRACNAVGCSAWKNPDYDNE
jgi:YD repeat-containing protein